MHQFCGRIFYEPNSQRQLSITIGAPRSSTLHRFATSRNKSRWQRARSRPARPATLAASLMNELGARRGQWRHGELMALGCHLLVYEYCVKIGNIGRRWPQQTHAATCYCLAATGTLSSVFRPFCTFPTRPKLQSPQTCLSVKWVIALHVFG